MSEKHKICMIGATGVGKSSLVSRFVHSIFSERYATTIGVKIEAKEIQRDAWRAKLVLWDLSGEDEFQSVQASYLRGASGCLMVVDGTRPETFDTALVLEARARATTGDVPFIIALNKADLVATWNLDARVIDALRKRERDVVRTSAKTGEGVEDAFNRLADAIRGLRQEERWT